jgi:hypothetical protein
MKLVDDYLIDQRNLDWAKLLETWLWLLPPEFTVWLVNRYAELFRVVRWHGALAGNRCGVVHEGGGKP